MQPLFNALRVCSLHHLRRKRTVILRLTARNASVSIVQGLQPCETTLYNGDIYCFVCECWSGVDPFRVAPCCCLITAPKTTTRRKRTRQKESKECFILAQLPLCFPFTKQSPSKKPELPMASDGFTALSPTIRRQH